MSTDLPIPTEPLEDLRPVPWFTLTCRKCGAVDKVTVEDDIHYDGHAGEMFGSLEIVCECGQRTMLRNASPL